MKRALITGSSSGIGYAYAKYLSERGWYIDLVSQNIDRAKEAYEKLNYQHYKIHIHDLSSLNSITEITLNISTPDLIVANAGIGINGAAGKNTNENIEFANNLMFGGPIRLIEHYLPKMKERKLGRIVIISSIGALIPMPKSAIYAAVKSGIYAYGVSLNEELRNDNISVTVSLPGYVQTNIHKRSGLEHLTKQIPSWMWVSSEQVVRETEIASIKGYSKVIPGMLYRVASIFFNFKISKFIWKLMNGRK
jgi:hypothetical protein